jgi:hypothetical protein
MTPSDTATTTTPTPVGARHPDGLANPTTGTAPPARTLIGVARVHRAGWLSPAALLLVALISLSALFLMGALGAAPAYAESGGSPGAGWNPLISALEGLVPVAGAIGMTLGLLIIASSGTNSNHKALGLTVVGGAAAGTFVGFFATDIAAFLTQWI